MDAQDILKVFADEQGWDEDSQALLLCQFIDSYKLHRLLEDFLEDEAYEENELM